MSKTITTVTVENISEDDQRVLVAHGEPKETIEAGAEFETTPENAKDLQRMYPKIFKITSTFIDPVEPETASKGEITAAKVEVLQDVYTAVATSILPSIMAEIADDEVAEGVINDFNAILADANDDDHPVFALTKEQELVVTAEDIKNNPELPKDVKVGDKVTIPVPAYERPAVEAEPEPETTNPADGEKVPGDEKKNGAQNVQNPPKKKGGQK